MKKFKLGVKVDVNLAEVLWALIAAARLLG